MSERKLIYYFQWIRALGAVAIVALHGLTTVHVAAGPDVLSEGRILTEEAFVLVATRWVVPSFFMMSGALMLDPKREMGWDKTLRHAWRMIFVLLTFGFAFCIVESVVTMGSLSPEALGEAVYNLFTGQSWDHMWYVYSLLGFYLLTPVIRPWISQASREELGRVTLWTTVLLLGSKLASVPLRGTLYNVLGLPYCFAYYLMGYYVHTYLQLDKRWIALGLASLLAMLGFRLFAGWLWVGDPSRGLVTPYAVLVMLLFKRYLEVPTEHHPLIELLADYSFGIYLVHPVFQHIMVELVDPVPYNAVLVGIVMTVVPLVLSLASVWLLRLVPGFKDKL